MEQAFGIPVPEGGSLHTRPLGIVQANGSLMFSEGGAIFRRQDGVRPSYEKIIDLNEDTDTDVGGIRGLTTIENPNGGVIPFSFSGLRATVRKAKSNGWIRTATVDTRFTTKQ